MHVQVPGRRTNTGPQKQLTLVDDLTSAADPGTVHYTEEQLARWAREDAFSMKYGTVAFLTGWLVTFVVFCLGLSAYSGYPFSCGGFGWGLLPFALLYGLPVAIVFGLPLALLVAWTLRRVRNQWLHVLAFALAVGAAMGVAAWFSYSFEMLWAVASLAGWAGASAAIGRAVVIPMVARRI